MSRIGKICTIIVLLAALAAPAGAQMAVPVAPMAPMVPVPPGVVPGWTVVPSAPMVYYAPNVGGDVFRHHGKYYYYNGGAWYLSKHLHGPWHPCHKLPREIYLVQRPYFKSAPPW